jgi:hypothetical protein
VTASGILDAVAGLQTQPNDAILVYYAGHGAYDPRASLDEPSGGHILQIPGGDLLRKDLVSALHAKNARLTVLVTDTCNSAFFPTIDRQRLVIPTMGGGNRALDHLLFEHSGFVDVNGSSRDTLAWFSSVGGWFTFAFQQASREIQNDQRVTWARFLQSVDRHCQAIFASEKSKLANTPAMSFDALRSRILLLQQQTQRPQVFAIEVRPSYY